MTTSPSRINLRRVGGKPVGVRIRPDKTGAGVFVKAGPLMGTLSEADTIRLATELVEALDQLKTAAAAPAAPAESSPATSRPSR